ncbi:MAG TPA: hypothetical protein VKJ07_21740, partial [Mycobacteriales bacterium]|nr:hypothetical protein [Mycobacteriales bacterium]
MQRRVSNCQTAPALNRCVTALRPGILAPRPQYGRVLTPDYEAFSPVWPDMPEFARSKTLPK